MFAQNILVETLYQKFENLQVFLQYNDLPGVQSGCARADDKESRSKTLGNISPREREAK